LDSKTSYGIFDSQLQLAQRWKKQIFKGLMEEGWFVCSQFFELDWRKKIFADFLNQMITFFTYPHFFDQLKNESK
jgi:hypothetical protein